MASLRKLRRLLPLRQQIVQPDATIDLGRYAALPSGYRPGNSSIVRFEGGFLVCVRGGAHTLDEKAFVHGNVDRLPALNRLFVLNDDLSFRAHAPVRPEELDGIEDLKLFAGLGCIWGIGSVLIPDDANPHACAITLVELSADLTRCRRTRLESPFGFRQEKNWSPFVVDEALHFVYSWNPTLVLRYAPGTRTATFVEAQRRQRGSVVFLEGGSSGGIPDGSGTLFLTHRRVVRLPSRRRVYLTRFRRLHGDLTSTEAGPFFSIGDPAIRFANGLVLDPERVLITYGERDGAARLACFARNRLNSLMASPVADGRPQTHKTARASLQCVSDTA